MFSNCLWNLLLLHVKRGCCIGLIVDQICFARTEKITEGLVGFNREFTLYRWEIFTIEQLLKSAFWFKLNFIPTHKRETDFRHFIAPAIALALANRDLRREDVSWSLTSTASMKSLWRETLFLNTMNPFTFLLEQKCSQTFWKTTDKSSVKHICAVFSRLIWNDQLHWSPTIFCLQLSVFPAESVPHPVNTFHSFFFCFSLKAMWCYER